MTTLTTRAGKGAPLTHDEVDANFNNLNTDKYEAGDNPSFGSVTVTGTVDGRDVAADGLKLDGIEVGATADQTAGEIEAIVNHNNLLGYVANQHIDWTTDQGATNIAAANVPEAGNAATLENNTLNDVLTTAGNNSLAYAIALG